MGNNPSAEDPRDGYAVRAAETLPPMVLAIEEVMWRGMFTVQAGKEPQIDIVPVVDGVQVQVGVPFPPGPIWVQPKEPNSLLTLNLYPRPELGEAAAEELQTQLLLPFDRLAALGAPLFTSLLLGLPFGAGSAVTINQAIQSASDPSVPKILITLFRPQLPWEPGAGRPYPDIKTAISSDDSSLGSCMAAREDDPMISQVAQVGGVIQAVRVANETTLHLQAATAEALGSCRSPWATAAGVLPQDNQDATTCVSESYCPSLSGSSILSRVQQQQQTLWQYQGTDGAPLGIREQPQMDAARTGEVLLPGEVFAVAQERAGTGGVTFLMLADSRGWVFDAKPGVGTLCVRRQQAVGDKDSPTAIPIFTGSSSAAGGVASIAELIVSLTRRQEAGKLSEAEARAREALILSQSVLQSSDMKDPGFHLEAVASLRTCAEEMAQEMSRIEGRKPQQLMDELQEAIEARNSAEAAAAECVKRLENSEELARLHLRLQEKLSSLQSDLDAAKLGEQRYQQLCLEAQTELRCREEGWQSELVGAKAKAQSELKNKEQLWQGERSQIEAKAQSELQSREQSWHEELAQMTAREQKVQSELTAAIENEKIVQLKLHEVRGQEMRLQVEVSASRAREEQLQKEVERLRMSNLQQESELSRLGHEADLREQEVRTQMRGLLAELNEMRIRDQMNKALSSQLEATEKQRQQLDGEVLRLQGELKGAHCKEQQHAFEQKALERQSAELLSDVSRRDSEINRLQEELDGYIAKSIEEGSRALQELDALRASVDEQGQKNLELANELEEMRGELRVARTENEALRLEKDATTQQLHCQLNAALSDTKTAKADSEVARSEVNVVHAEAAAAQRELEAMRAQLQAAGVERDAARAEARAAHCEADAWRAEVDASLARVDVARQEVEVAHADRDKAQMQRDAARAATVEASRKADAAIATADALQAESEAQLTELHAQVQASSAEADAARAAATTALADAAKARAETEMVREEAEKCSSKLVSELASAKAETAAMRAEAEADREKAETCRSALVSELASAKAGTASIRAEAEVAREEAEKCNYALASELASAKAEMDSMRTEAEVRRGEAEKCHSALASELASAKVEMDSMRTEAEVRIREAEKCHSAFASKLATAKAEMDSLRAEAQAAREEAEKRCSALVSELALAQADADSMRVERDRQAQLQSESHAQLQDTRQMLEEATRNHESKMTELRDRQSQMASELHLLQELRDELDDTQRALRVARSEQDALRDQAAACSSELQRVLQLEPEATLAQLEESRRELQSMKSEVQTAHRALEAARSETEAVRGELKLARSESQAAFRELDCARSEQEARRDQLEALRSESQALREALEVAKEDGARRRESEEQLQRSVTEAEEQERELKMQLEEARSGSESMYSELLELRDRVHQHQQMELELKSHRRREKEYQDLQDEVLKKCTQLNNLRTRLKGQTDPCDAISQTTSKPKMDLKSSFSPRVTLARNPCVAALSTTPKSPHSAGKTHPETITTETQACVDGQPLRRMPDIPDSFTPDSFTPDAEESVATVTSDTGASQPVPSPIEPVSARSCPESASPLGSPPMSCISGAAPAT